MQHKFLLPAVIAFLLSFLINFLTHQNLLVSLMNSLTLSLSILLFRNYLKDASLSNSLIIISLGLIPLFTYLPNHKLISFFLLFSLGFFILYKHFPNKKILIIWALFLIIANFYSGEIIKYPFNIQSTQLIFNSPEINFNIKRHQQDALYIPFKMRQVLYSNLIYIYAIFTNFFDFFNLKNLSDVFLIANLYPIFTGFYLLFKHKNQLRNFILTTLLLTIFTAGIDRSPDKYQSLYTSGPIFIYLIILSLQTINKKFYFALMVLSIFLLLNPII